MKKLFSIIGLFGFSALAYADDELAEATAQAPQSNPWMMPIMLGVGFVLIYFMIMRPERKRRRDAQMRRDALRKGDRVTAMGIRGTVAKIEAETVVLKLYDGAKMEILKAAITDVDQSGSGVVDEVEQPAT